MSLSVQALSIIHMVLAGNFLGISFDTYARLRIKYKNKAFMIVQDLLFWIANGLFIFIWLKSINEGDVRIYVFLALLCGYAMYISIFQSTYKKTLEYVIQLILKIYEWVIHIGNYLIVQPIKKLFSIIILLLGALLTLLLSFFSMIYRFLCFCSRPFHPMSRKLYNWVRSLFSAKQTDIDGENKEEEITEKKGFLAWVAKWFNTKRS